MSGFPNEAGVRELLDLFEQQGELLETIEDLAPKVQSMTDRLQSARAEYEQMSNRSTALVRSMDIESPGNFGYQSRMASFLNLLYRDVRRRLEDKYRVPPPGT